MLGLHAGCLQAAAEARLRVFPAQAANQPGLPSAAQPLRRRCVDQSASRRLRKHQHEGSMCEEKSQAELCQENCRAGSIRQTPYGTGQLPERRAHQDAALSAKALCPLQKGGKLSGPRRGVHQGSYSFLLSPEHSPGSKWDTSCHSRIEGCQGLDHVGDGLQRCSGVSCGFPQAQPCVAKTKEACPH
jgi:hypothetical protein